MTAEPDEPEVTRTGYGPAEEDGAPEDAGERTPPTGGGPGPPSPDGDLRCDLCGGPVLDRHCKIVCLNCGYQRDCSDP